MENSANKWIYPKLCRIPDLLPSSSPECCFCPCALLGCESFHSYRLLIDGALFSNEFQGHLFDIFSLLPFQAGLDSS